MCNLGEKRLSVFLRFRLIRTCVNFTRAYCFGLMTLIIPVLKFFNPTKLVVDVLGFAAKETEESLVMKRILCSSFPRVFSLSFFLDCKKVKNVTSRSICTFTGIQCFLGTTESGK